MKLKSLVLAGVIVLAGVLAISSGKFDFTPANQKIINKEEKKEGKLILTINDGSGQEKTFEGDFKEGLTAFQLLEETAEGNNIELRTKIYDFGVLIEAIGEKSNGQDGSYWMYYINGTLPMVGADQYFLNPGDKIEFKFEKSSF